MKSISKTKNDNKNNNNKTLASVLSKQKRNNLLLYLLGLVLYIGGIVSISYYPGQAHKTYMSENALLPGVAKIEFEQADISDSIRFSQEYQAKLDSCGPIRDAQCRLLLSHWIESTLKDIGLETYQHTFSKSPSPNPSPSSNSSTSAPSSEYFGYNLYSVIRAPKSDGTESLVLSTKYSVVEGVKLNKDEVNGVGLLLSIVGNLQRKARVWLAKDIVVVITDGHFGGFGMKQWLSDYHSNIHSRSTQFRRAGMIQAALNIDVQPNYPPNRFNILSEGSNGQLPNLDLINTIGRMAMKEGSKDRIFLSVDSGLGGDSQYYDPSPSSSSPTISHIARVVRTKINRWMSELIPSDMKTLSTFMSNQALGVPTGDHGLFNVYHIDAVTIALPTHQRQHTIYQNSVIIIGTLRSLNNLLEHLHQSFYYYLLPSPFTYISIGEYMLTLGCILAPLIVLVLVLLVNLSGAFKPPSLKVIKSSCITQSTTAAATQSTKERDNDSGVSLDVDSPYDILYSSIIVSLTLVVGLAFYSIPLTFSRTILSLLDHLSHQNSELADSALFIGFTLLYIVLFFVVYPRSDRYFSSRSAASAEAAALAAAAEGEDVSTSIRYLGGMSFKVFTCLPVLLFISTMSLLNFSFCTISAIFTVPLCIIPQHSSYRLLRWFQSLVTVLFSPPLVIYLISKFYLNQNVYTFISTLIRQHQMYSTLLFPFITLVYIPLHILTLKLINAIIITNNSKSNNKLKTN